MGKTSYTCTVCGEIEERIDIPINNSNHNYNLGIVTQQPTCTETGAKLYTCRINSSHTKTEIVPALGHNSVADTGKSYAATCTANGLSVTKCSVCNDELTRTTIAALGHTSVADTAKSYASTCSATGLSVTKCSVCDDELTRRIIAKKAHTYASGYARAQQPLWQVHVYIRVCTVCGYDGISSASSINWANCNYSNGWDATCNTCGLSGSSSQKNYKVTLANRHRTNLSLDTFIRRIVCTSQIKQY